VPSMGGLTSSVSRLSLDARPLPSAFGPKPEVPERPGRMATDPTEGPVHGRTAVMRAVAHRVDGGVWRMPAFATNADRRLFRQQVHVREFMREVPLRALGGILGPAASVEVPSSDARYRLIAATLSSKAGPEGGNVAKGLRAWRLHLAYVQKARALSAPPHDLGLPCSRAGVAAVLAEEATRSRSTGNTIREGFKFLAEVACMPFDMGSILVEAAAAHPDLAGADLVRPVRHAASMPLGVQCQIETVAASLECTVMRTLARCVLVSSLVHHVRLNDALNAKLCVGDGGTICGVTTVRSKHGVPLQLFAPAEGWLGPLTWWPEHAFEMSSRMHAIPEFEGSSVLTSRSLKPGVIKRERVIAALRDLCSLPPLSMTGEEFDALRLSMHSPHGTGADMTRFMGTELEFEEKDARAMGHWLRDKNAPQEVSQPGGHHTVGARNARDSMSLRYTQGEGRRGERAEQLSLRNRFVIAVRNGLLRAGRSWWDLPKTLESWDVLLPSYECP